MIRLKKYFPILAVIITIAALSAVIYAETAADNDVNMSLVLASETELNVYVDGSWSDTLSDSYGYGDTATLNAPDVENKSFSHWETDGSVISYSNPLNMTMNASTTLYAVYAETAPAEKAACGFTSVTRTNDGTQISFQAIADPADGTVKSAGIVYSTSAAGDALIIGGDGVENSAAEQLTDSTETMPASILDDNSCWMLKITPDAADTVYNARAYVTIGEETTYGDEKEIKLSDLESGISQVANLEGFEQGINDELEALASNRTASEVTQAPTAKKLTYTGNAQELVTAGTAEGGTMQYALGSDDTNVPVAGWGTSIPEGTEVGTYYVWYKAGTDASHSDSEAACITAAIDAAAPAPDSKDEEKKEEETIVVPVSGDESEKSVQVSASITTDESGTTSATVAEVTTEEIDKVAEENGTVTIDLTAIKTKTGEETNVTSVTLSTKTVESVIGSKASSLEIKLDSATAVIDGKTLETLAEDGKDTITLVIDKDEKAEAALNDEQKKAIAGMDNATVLDAYFISGGQRISDFKGGTVQLTAVYSTEKPVTVLYIDGKGNKEKIASAFDAVKKVTTFKVNHFSNYVITETKANTLTVKAKKSVKVKVRKKAKSVKAIKVSNAVGTVSYKKLSGNKKITVNKKNGRITVKKGTKKGTYKIKVKVTAAGGLEYAEGSKVVTVKVKVK